MKIRSLTVRKKLDIFVQITKYACDQNESDMQLAHHQCRENHRDNGKLKVISHFGMSKIDDMTMNKVF